MVCDPATSYTAEDFVEWLTGEGIALAVTAGEAHYQLGSGERHIQTIKTVARKLLSKYPNAPLKDLMAAAAAAHNQQERVSGYSPVQWAFGAAGSGPRNDAVGRLTERGFADTELYRITAEQLHVQVKADQRISRALNTINRPLLKLKRGQLVHFWRKRLGAPGNQTRKEGGADQHVR